MALYSPKYIHYSDLRGSTVWKRSYALHSERKILFMSLSPGIPGEPIPVESEEEIFAIIDFPYKTPSERNFGK